jgi:EmrB/QacA subfamily drug resistance transporter
MASSRTDARTDRSGNLTLALLCLTQFVVVLDIAIVNVALPDIGRELGFRTGDLQWVVNAYTLTFAGLLLLGGRLADLLGRRRVFMSGLVLFGAASLVGGLSVSPGMLIAARAAQGVGAALLSPAALALLNSTFAQGPARNRALAVWGGTAGSGAAAGVLLGGVLTSTLGWQWVLLVNVPIVALAVVAAPALLAEGRDTGLPRSFDLPGAVLVTSGLVAVVYAVVGSETAGLTSPTTVLTLAAGGLLLLAFVAVERRASAPLVPLRVFRQRSLTGANLVFLLHPTGPTAVLFLGSIYLQDVLGYDALRSGVAFLPFALLAAVGAALAGRLLSSVRPDLLATGGMLAMAAGLIWLTQLSTGSSYLTGVLPGTALIGVGITVAFVPLTVLAFDGLPNDQHGLASGLINSFQQIGAALVLAVLATLASSHTAGRVAAGQPEVSALADGISRAFATGAVLLTLGAALVVVLLRPRGRDAVDDTARTTPADVTL